MGVLLICDAPGCMLTVPAAVVLSRPAAPPGWWLQPGTHRLIVACCEAHLSQAVKSGVSRT